MNQYQSESCAALYAALCKAQSEMPTVTEDSINPHFKSKYASLKDMVKASRPSLTKNGLCVIQKIVDEEGASYLLSILGHTSGEWTSSKMGILPDKPGIQARGFIYHLCATIFLQQPHRAGHRRRRR